MAAFTNYTDQDLLELLREGEQEALGELYDRYHASLYVYALRYLKIDSLAEDVLQDVFIKLWEAREKLNIQVSFSGYLRRMTHNQAMDSIKGMKKDKELKAEIALTMDIEQCVEAASLIAANEQLLENALQHLPPQRRHVFVLCREEGKTYQQAADVLGISRHTVKEYMSDALRMLRQALLDPPDTGK